MSISEQSLAKASCCASAKLHFRLTVSVHHQHYAGTFHVRLGNELNAINFLPVT